jgi:hypothetical protein
LELGRRRKIQMNAIGDVFCDEATRRALENYRDLAAHWKRDLDRAQPNHIVELPSDGFPGGLSGVALSLKYPVDQTHSGWLFRYMFDASQRQDVSQVVGVAVRGGDFKKLTQSRSIGATGRLYIIATGPRAQPILQAAIDSENRFDPGMFDSDGYLRS